MSFLSKIFGDANEKAVLKMQPIIEKINELEKEFEGLSPEELKNKTKLFRERLQKGEELDNILPEAFAACREAAKRTIGQRHFDAQLIGAMVLHQGKIAEMKTGEGKTLSATLAVYLNALSGDGAHVITVNDYLSKRDANWMGPIYHALGMRAACIVHDKAYVFEPQASPDANEVTVEMQNLKEVKRQEAYAADITYGTNNEFGFDYLRDNMSLELGDMAQRGHNFAIVDEVDSILIDEARTPLIISAPDAESTKMYEQFARIVPQLKEEADYNIDHKMRAVTLTEEGIAKIEKILGMDIYNEGGIRYVHHLEQALRAHALFKRDKDYVVKDGEVVIVDDFTGRLMFGRRYSEGLHQAIEAKEGAKVQQESRTLATITFQNYFRMYKKLAGMTGTAATSAEEFVKVYKLDVVDVPTNKPMVREDLPDQVYKNERGKFTAVVREIKEKHEKGQPVLVGTVSIEKNERLSAFLKKEGIPHELLNAKNHEQEAKIIAKAGAKGAVTVATNMAGRGVDIKLEEGVVGFGGLHIIGTERHEARRIDDQLRGRSGRQGDPGSSRFFVSLEDELMRIFGSDRIKKMMEFLNVPEDQPIENKMISKAIESAQGKIEGFNFDIRKHVLDYDDVMNKQRETIYRMRKEILENKVNEKENPPQPSLKGGSVEVTPPLGGTEGYLTNGLRQRVFSMVEKEIKGLVVFNASVENQEEWNFEEIYNAANFMFPLPLDAQEKIKEFKSPEEIENYLLEAAKSAYEIKEKEVGQENMRQIEKIVLLRTIDNLWMDHLDNMDHLRDSVRLRAYGQKDPLVEYKNEGRRLFYDLLAAINASVAKTIYKVTIAKEPRYYHPVVAQKMEYKAPQKTSAPATNSGPSKKEPRRNDPCPCGSGKKYKKCHGA